MLALLLLFTWRILAESSESSDVNLQSLLATVDDLNHDLTIQTNVFIEFTNSTPSNELHTLTVHTAVPKLIVCTTEEVSLKVVGQFCTRVLTVVLLHGDENIEQSLNLLKSVLWQLHYKDVLFVGTAGVPLPLQQIFIHCWFHGFTNVLVLIGTHYYTYHRFPQLRVVELPELRNYHDKSHMSNWYGHPLRSTVLYGSPRSYHYVDRITGESHSSGYLYNLVIDFVNHHNATFVRKLIGANHTDLELACLAFKRREIDIMTTVVYIHPGYSRSIVPTNLHVYIVVPHAQPLRNFQYFVKPLKRWAWTILALITVAIFLQLVLIQRVQVGDGSADYSAALLHAQAILLYLPYNSRLLRTHVRVCFMLIILANGFMANMYTSSLSSMLTSKLYEPQIMKYSDIDRTEMLLLKAALDIEIWSNLSSMSPIIKNRLRTVEPKHAYELLRNLSTEHILADVEDRVDFFMYQQKFLKVPRVKKLNRVLHTIPLFIPFPHNSPYLQLFNRYLRHSFEHGLYRKFLDEANDEGIKNGEIRFFESDYTPFMQLGLTHLNIFFIGWWTTGLLFATIVFVLEKCNLKFFA